MRIEFYIKKSLLELKRYLFIQPIQQMNYIQLGLRMLVKIKEIMI